jgi:hypothetical protein
VLKAQINKTDRNDARGIAQMIRVGLYRPVHVKTLRSQKLRMLLTHRKLLQSKAIAIENDLRGTLRNFGLKVGMVGTVCVLRQTDRRAVDLDAVLVHQFKFGKLAEMREGWRIGTPRTIGSARLLMVGECEISPESCRRARFYWRRSPWLADR